MTKTTIMMDQDLLLPYVPQYLQNSLKVPQSSVYDGDDDDGEDDGSELPSYLREERREEEAGPSMGKRQIGPTLPSYAPTYDPTTHYDVRRRRRLWTKTLTSWDEVCTKHQIYFPTFLLMSYLPLFKTGCSQTQEPSTGRMDACPTFFVKSSWK